MKLCVIITLWATALLGQLTQVPSATTGDYTAAQVGAVPSGGAYADLSGASKIGTTTGTVAAGDDSRMIRPYAAFPHRIASGAGTEASPWTHSDTTAGIQTEIASLASTRGGLISLAPGRFNSTGTISITTPCIILKGDVAGFPGNPNAEAQPVVGTSVIHAASGNGVLVGNANAAIRPGGIQIRDLALWGNGRTMSSDTAAIDVNGHADQPQFKNLRVNNWGSFLYVTTAISLDGAHIDNNSVIGNGLGIFFETGSATYNTQITSNEFWDNDAQHLYARASATQDTMTVSGNAFGRGCRISSCQTLLDSHPANVVWVRNDSTLVNNRFIDAGWCFPGSGFCGAGSYHVADELYLGGNGNVVTGNKFYRTAVQTGAAGIRVAGSRNTISGNAFTNCETDIIVLSGASDNWIAQPGANVSDSGTRTVVNGVGKNAGDPDTTGDWASATKWPGLIIQDTTNHIRYLYYVAASRTIVDQGSLPSQSGNGGKFLTTDGTNASWGAVTGGSGSTTFDTFTNRPTCNSGANGTWFYPTNHTGLYANYCDGSVWKATFGGKWVNPPPARSNWTVLNSASGYDDAGSVRIDAPAVSGDSIKGLYKAFAVSGATNVTAKITCNSEGPPANNCGVLITDGTKIQRIAVAVDAYTTTPNVYSVDIDLCNYTNATTWSSCPIMMSLNPGSISGSDLYFRYEDDGATNRKWSVSFDGHTFKTIYTAGRTTFLEPTGIGFDANSNSASMAVSTTLIHWLEQ